MKKGLLISAILCGLATSTMAQNILVNTSVYTGYTDYSSSIVKDNGYIVGLYTYIGVGLHHSLEAEFDFTKINYQSSGSLKQFDGTLLYTYYFLNGDKVKVATHYIASDDDATDGGVVGVLGYEKYINPKLQVSVEGAVSYYNDYQIEKTYIKQETTKMWFRNQTTTTTETTTSTGLTVYQVSPAFVYRIGGLSLKTKGYYIKLSDSAGFGKDFSSVEETITYAKGSFVAEAYGWVGRQEFVIKNGGFVVYNLSEKYKSGFGASLKFIPTTNSFMKVGVNRERFDEIDNDETTSSTTFYFFGGVSF
ncbi:MAG: hypothetical protein GXO45_01630 [Aquificae bacterium]|nr:hypothetical protein [Aquificota bacterium]